MASEPAALASEAMSSEPAALASGPTTPASLAAPPVDDEHDAIHTQVAKMAQGAAVKRKDRTVRRFT
jgi:hypothetical protein